MGKCKTVLAWSTGKDSCYALHMLNQSASHTVVGLLSMFSAYGRVFMHAVRPELAEAQAMAAGVPLARIDLPLQCSNEDYEALLVAALKAAYDKGVRAVAFGDLFLEGVREHREYLAHRAGLEAVFPLWLEDRDTLGLARRMILDGVDAIVTCVDPTKLDRLWIGKSWQRLVADLPHGIDPCAEMGEFHTFAVSSPAFRTKITVELGEVVSRDGFVFVDLLSRRD